jgi:hypothetical protein
VGPHTQTFTVRVSEELIDQTVLNIDGGNTRQGRPAVFHTAVATKRIFLENQKALGLSQPGAIFLASLEACG